MKTLSSILRTNLVPPRAVWIAEGAGAVLAMTIAFACDPELWLIGTTAAFVAVALAVSSLTKLDRQLR
jgi:hypothetical protein